MILNADCLMEFFKIVDPQTVNNLNMLLFISANRHQEKTLSGAIRLSKVSFDVKYNKIKMNYFPFNIAWGIGG